MIKREIKFRARWKDTGKPIPDFNEEYIIDAVNDDIFIVEQYTGVTDKNGVEIYEGDILNLGEEDANVQVFWSTSALAFMIGEPNECVPLNWFSDKYHKDKVFVCGSTS